jgi:hypothetical protein
VRGDRPVGQRHHRLCHPTDAETIRLSAEVKGAERRVCPWPPPGLRCARRARSDQSRDAIAARSRRMPDPVEAGPLRARVLGWSQPGPNRDLLLAKDTGGCPAADQSSANTRIASKVQSAQRHARRHAVTQSTSRFIASAESLARSRSPQPRHARRLRRVGRSFVVLKQNRECRLGHRSVKVRSSFPEALDGAGIICAGNSWSRST